MTPNVPGIATVADLRAAFLSTRDKPHAKQRATNYHQAPLLLAIPCWRFVALICSFSLPFNTFPTLYLFLLLNS